ncbi:hypothetical protein CVU82_04435 [Candidatus Falkowbacteria bacterium HGW-Falkowbacteria-1]|uniref:Fibronectin type-III domain-containing protein n=1 Tax=Candidatus Falkowbacteria bacterium HGW-Falkowbacteria-1 TaxID=2013768 RepID=A0A2N2E8L3_9BACT|nr:MAG: hypothetical protein CVU82_04435 [Candidatus Falkowbacteria bacterium HGW-Falkowbacteria-1]
MFYKKNLFKHFFAFFLIAFFCFNIFVFPFLVSASDVLGTAVVENQIGLSSTDPRAMASRIINIALSILGIVAVGIVIYGGFVWMTSEGNEERVTKAKGILKAGVIGLTIILSAWGVTAFIFNKLGDATGVTNVFCENGSVKACGCGGIATCVNNSWESCVGSSCLPGSNGSWCSSGLGNSCQPDNSQCNSGLFCNTSCACTYEGEGDPCGQVSEGVCDNEAEPVCSNPILSCSSDTCTCVAPDGDENISELGEPCGEVFNCGDKLFYGDHEYSTVEIGDQCWFSENLKYDNGCSSNVWSNNVDTGWCGCYNNNPTYCTDYGLLYQWSAAMNDSSQEMSQGVCPDGWHIPSHDDITKLEREICTSASCEGDFPYDNVTTGYRGTDEGVKLISNGSSGFESELAGYRYTNSGVSAYINNSGYFWSSSLSAVGTSSWYRRVSLDFSGVSRSVANKANGFSVRCVKDEQGAATVCDSDKVCNSSHGLTCGDCVCSGNPVITGFSPIGGFCQNNINQPCLQDEECSSGVCDKTTPNAATGNFVTIFGYNFDEYNESLSGVNFIRESDNLSIAGIMPSVVNSYCGNTWSNTQIIVAMPSGFTVSNDVLAEVVTKSSKTDRSNDAVGPQAGLIKINNIERPGLCRINPGEAKMNDQVLYYGVNLSDSKVYFGNYNTNVSGFSPNTFNNNISGEITTPNLNVGDTNTFAKKLDTNVPSNFLDFKKLPEPPKGPSISFFEPTIGKEGQYVSIYGSGFGPSQGSSQVYFSAGSDISASFDFPSVCLHSVWKDDQIIIKVPENINYTNPSYQIKIKIGEWEDIFSNDFFVASSTAPLLPSLCKINPSFGPDETTSVSFWGEYFSESGKETKTAFSFNKVSDSLNVVLEGDAEKLVSIVPIGASTGPVKVSRGGLLGNGLNFNVGTCSKDSDCSSGQICCGSKTTSPGACVVNINDCLNGAPPSSVFEWGFDTGFIGDENDDDNDDDIFSCASYNFCPEGYVCPNSPGLCSPYNGLNQINVGICTSNCSSFSYCGVNGEDCEYLGYSNEKLIDKCVLKNNTCSKYFSYDLGEGVEEVTSLATCKEYNIPNVGQRFFYTLNISTSCPSINGVQWVKTSDGSCVNVSSLDSPSTCSLCPGNSSCSPEGICISPKLCPVGSSCAEDQCVKMDSPSCQCCCDKDQNSLSDLSNPSCCYPLTCGYSCGISANVNSTVDNFGLCSGCKIEEVEELSTWTAQVLSGARGWYSLDSSSDGSKLAAVVRNGYVYTSIDFGKTWVQRNSSGSRAWADITSSSDGVHLAATVDDGYIYTSSDSGATWVQQESIGLKNWRSIASSSNGEKLVAIVQGDYIYTSSDSGSTWFKRAVSIGPKNWSDVASSLDGTKLVAVVRSGYVYTSSDSGATWTAQTSVGSKNWYSVSSSADGSKLIASVYNGNIYISSDYGTTWMAQTSAGTREWWAVGSSDDGVHLAAVDWNKYIYTSSDSGATWTAQTSAGQRSWYSVEFSFGGSRIAAAAFNNYVYTYSTSYSYPAVNDSACNCSGTSGKYCEVNSQYTEGACLDCTALGESACKEHNSACCWDSKKNTCHGGVSDDSVWGSNTGSFGYCPYYDCDSNDATVCLDNEPKTLGQYKDKQACVNGCSENCGQLESADACISNSNCCWDAGDLSGEKCVSGERFEDDSSNVTPGYCKRYNCSATTNLCAINSPVLNGKYLKLDICVNSCKETPAGFGESCGDNENITSCLNTCNKLDCLTEDGVLGTAPSCGVCCCDPNAVEDQCSQINEKLACYENIDGCSGGDRGLCCGCKSDDDCVRDDFSPEEVGCGMDSCCKARPKIENTFPENGQDNVCHNASISIDFDQRMDNMSFPENVLLLEESSTACSSGTYFISQKQNFSIFEKIKNTFTKPFYYLSGFINKNAFAAFDLGDGSMALPNITSKNKVYCSVLGSVDFRHDADDKTSLIFSPNSLLKEGTKYFVVIKGDEDLNGGSGVISAQNIGMNGRGYQVSAVDWVEGETSKLSFNNLNFKNSYIFSFETINSPADQGGICSVDNVLISPDSYLFSSNTNDLQENDNDSSHKSFDSVSDHDKAYYAYALSSDNQILNPVVGYSWSWNWNIANEGIVYFKDGVVSWAGNDDKRLIGVKANVADDQTLVGAKVVMNSANIISEGDGTYGSTPVYVFVCKNPWPAINPDGTWAPWRDTGSSSSNYNYEFYYCRDAGSDATSDDLPAFLSNLAVVKGQSPINVCSNLPSRTCSDSNDCPPGGFCVSSFLKEAYFFKERIPKFVENVFVSDSGTGGSLDISWSSDSTLVDKYKIYYRVKGESVYQEKLVQLSGNCEASDNVNLCDYQLGDLLNNVSYEVKITALSINLAETGFSTIVYGTPTDSNISSRPTQPKIEILSHDNRLIRVSWEAPVGYEVEKYRVYRGSVSGVYGSSILTNDNSTEVDISLSGTQNDTFYFVISSINPAGVEGEKSSEVFVYFNDPSISLFEYIFDNIDFESTVVGGLPLGWTKNTQGSSSVGVSSLNGNSGNQSVLIKQDIGHDYPGKCNQSTCNNLTSPKCTWDNTNKTCSFSSVDDCKKTAPAVYQENETLCWGNSNRVMWASLKYDLVSLNFKENEKYAVKFNYKGNSVAQASVNVSPSSGWSSQCISMSGSASLRSPFVWLNGKVSPTPLDGQNPCNPSYGSPCLSQTTYCCRQSPAQEKCYAGIASKNIEAGIYGDWQTFFQTFEYNDKMALWLRSDYTRMMELAITLSYVNTLVSGSDFYIDDFSLIKIS